MAARVAEHVVQESAGPVDHRGLLREPRRRRHEPEDGQHPFDAIEVAQLGPEHRERVQGAPAGRLRALLDVDVVAHHTGMDEHTLVVAGELARRAGTPAVDDDRVERLVGRVRPWEHDPEGVEAVLHAGHRRIMLAPEDTPPPGLGTGR